MSKSSILVDTLTEIKEIRESIEQNASHILKSTLKEDLEAIIKKGLFEAEDDMSDDSYEEPMDDNETDDMGDDDSEDMGGEDFEVVDLTDEPMDKVSAEFERMRLSDEIEIVKTPEGGFQINIEPDDGNEMDLGGDMGDDEDEIDFGGGEDDEDFIELEDDEEDENDNEEENEDSEEDDDEEEASDEDDVIKEVDDALFELNFDEVDNHLSNESKHDMDELHETLVKTRRKLQQLVVENKKKSNELTKVKKLVKEFESADQDYKKAIKSLKSQLQEVALFTSNLTYAVKLMTENTTTKDEKLDILKRFDSAKSLNESKNVYDSLNSLLKQTKNSNKNTIEEKILNKPKNSGASKLNESNVYKNPQLERMLDLIGKIK
jgi:hypothetical protein